VMMVQKERHKCFRSTPYPPTIRHTPHVHCTFPIRTSCSLHLSERSHRDLAAYERARLALTSSTLLFKWHTVYVTSCLLPTDTTHSIQFNSKYKNTTSCKWLLQLKNAVVNPIAKSPFLSQRAFSNFSLHSSLTSSAALICCLSSLPV
jgi:hypothetical protein